MTKEMRALIEAAEAVLLEYKRTHTQTAEGRKNVARSIEALKAAISSAKAAEEGVETKWRVEYRNLAREWMKESYIPESLEAAHARLENCAINTRGVRLAQYDTYTTVIEVREKEGL